MGKKNRIVIAEDHTVLREGLRALLSAHADLEVVGEAENGYEAIRLAEKLSPDLMLMDLSMPRMNGMDAIGEVKKRSPQTKVLVLTVHKTDEYIVATLQAGADGYVLKDSSHGELEMAIQSVLAGRRFISPGISERLIDGYLEGRKPGRLATPWDTLTQRERGILKLIAEGHKNREISDYLCISVKTVEKHRATLMQKLNLHNVSDLTAFAIAKGVISR